ncbi:hypothetical protein IM538_03905 [Cytobacillus suaedae]|nr:hypothetical protein IM538_03905 [Cytobacillus suaedae]
MSDFIEVDFWTCEFESVGIGCSFSWDNVGFSLTRSKSDYFSLLLYITDLSLIDDVLGTEKARAIANQYPNCVSFTSSKSAAEFFVMNILPIYRGVDTQGCMILE